jgi:hypothetical protein
MRRKIPISIKKSIEFTGTFSAVRLIQIKYRKKMDTRNKSINPMATNPLFIVKI